MTYAKIENGLVTNLLEIHPANINEFSDCVPVNDRPVQIGDTYVDGVFMHDGKVIKNSYDLLAETEALNQMVFAILKGEGNS